MPYYDTSFLDGSPIGNTSITPVNPSNGDPTDSLLSLGTGNTDTISTSTGSAISGSGPSWSSIVNSIGQDLIGVVATNKGTAVNYGPGGVQTGSAIGSAPVPGAQYGASQLSTFSTKTLVIGGSLVLLGVVAIAFLAHRK